MTVAIQKSCPLGHTCERISEVGGVIDRCHWYIRLKGQNPQSGEEVDSWGCAIAWMPVLAIETAKTGRDQTAAIQVLRDEVSAGNRMLAVASQQALRMQGLAEKQITPGGNGEDSNGVVE